MSNNPQEVTKMVGIYKKLFLLLAVVTALGVAIAYLRMPFWAALLLALIIMAVKSKVVIDSFKHLIAGRNSILILFGLTVIFFIAVVLLPLLNHEGQIKGTVDTSKEIQAQEKPMEVKHHGH